MSDRESVTVDALRADQLLAIVAETKQALKWSHVIEFTVSHTHKHTHTPEINLAPRIF